MQRKKKMKTERNFSKVYITDKAVRALKGGHPWVFADEITAIEGGYENGELVKAVTRGNGIVGEVITNNAKVFKNIPLRIPYKGQLVLRGEAIITYSEFERIN